jgi:S1-C subfamily serine protease
VKAIPVSSGHSNPTSINYDLTKAIKRADSSVIKVYTKGIDGEYDRQGSGIILTKDGICVTNYHVLAGAQDGEIVDFEGNKYAIEWILDYNDSLDLIKFKIRNNQYKLFKPVTKSKLLPEKGLDVFAVGYPNGFILEGGVLSVLA